MMTRVTGYLIGALALGLSACTNPYDPVQRGFAGGLWERPLVPPLERRRAAGRVPRSEQRSEGQRGFSGASRLHRRRHRAPIMATQPTGILPIGIRHTDTQA